jgi:TonB family protein
VSALVISAAVHAGALAIAVSLPDRYVAPPDKNRMTLVEFDVREVVPSAPPPPVTEPEEKKALPEKREPRPRVPTPSASTPEVLASDSPRSDTPTEPLRAPTPERPTLIPLGSFVLALDAGVFAPDDEPRGLRAPTVSKDLVGDLARDTIGRGKVDRGLVHPYYAQLGKALTKNWDADRALSQKGGLAGYGEQFVQNTKIFNEIWLDKAAQFGATGAPIDAPVSNDSASRRTATVTNNIQGIGGVDLEARKEVARQMREQFKTTRRATIRVVQGADGKLTKVELLSPSNDSTVDREALADVRSAAEKLPPPPLEALEGRKELVSTWAFELVISISPPIPTFTFEFDEALGFIDARLPLDRRIYKKVRLVSVD